MRTKDSIFGGWGPRLMGVAAVLFVAAGARGNASAAQALKAHATCTLTSAVPTLAAAQRPGWPQSAFDSQSSGSVTLAVELDTELNVRSVGITKSSGDFDLDQAARRVGMAARFSLPDGACMSSPYTYGLIVEAA